MWFEEEIGNLSLKLVTFGVVIKFLLFLVVTGQNV